MQTQKNEKIFHKFSHLALIALLSIGAVCAANADEKEDKNSVKIDIFAPANGDHAGVGGRGWFVDLALEFPGDLQSSGFSEFQITGPGPHNNIAPFPGTFSPGADDRLPGLIVLLSGTTIGAQSCQNLANLFNLTGVTNVSEDGVELWDSWIVGAPLFGSNSKSTLYVAVAADSNGDNIYNDAPAVIIDSNGDGICNDEDLKALGLASKVKRVEFFIN